MCMNFELRFLLLFQFQKSWCRGNYYYTLSNIVINKQTKWSNNNNNMDFFAYM